MNAKRPLAFFSPQSIILVNSFLTSITTAYQRRVLMKLTKIEQVNEFLSIVDSCKGDVTLRSLDGDIFNLKSKLSQYIAIAALLGQHGDELELFCSDSADEAKFTNFLMENPSVS